MVQMRDVWAEEIEAALAGKKTAKQALDTAVTRGNAMLRTVREDGKVGRRHLERVVSCAERGNLRSNRDVQCSAVTAVPTVRSR